MGKGEVALKEARGFTRTVGGGVKGKHRLARGLERQAQSKREN